MSPNQTGLTDSRKESFLFMLETVNKTANMLQEKSNYLKDLCTRGQEAYSKGDQEAMNEIREELDQWLKNQQKTTL